MIPVHFVTYGVAQPQGSKSAYARLAKDGRPFATQKDANYERLQPWRAAVATAAQDWQAAHQVPLERGPIQAVLDFVFPQPASRKKETWHTVQPDIDKVARAVLDAMTGLIYVDDKQVCALTVYKRYDPHVPAQARVWLRSASVFHLPPTESETENG